MQTYRQLAEKCRDWIEDDASPHALRRTINSVIEQLTLKKFDALTESVVVTPQSGVITEPALCREITRIVSTSESPSRQRFLPAQGPLHLQGPTMVFDRYHPVAVDASWDARGIAFTVSASSRNQLTQAPSSTVDIPADVEGHVLRISNIPEVYEVVEVVEADHVIIRPEYSGAVMSGSLSIGNYGQRRYLISDTEGVPYSGAVRIEYQRRHPALLSDDDVFLLGIHTSVVYQTVMMLMQYAKYDVSAERLQAVLGPIMAAEMGQEAVNRPMESHKPSMFARQGARTRWERGR